MTGYTFKVTHDAVERTVYPTNSSFDLEWAKEDKFIFVRKVCETNFVFDGDDYEYFKAIDEGCDRCLRITLVIECPSGEIFQGWFNLNKARFSQKNCDVKMKPESFDDYTDVFEGWQTKYNILSFGSTTVYGGIGEFQMQTCSRVAVAIPPFQVDEGYDCGTYSTLGYAPYKHTVTYDGVTLGTHYWSQTTLWGRMFITGVSPPPSGGWIAVTGGWARPVNLGITNDPPNDDPNSWEFEILNFDMNGAVNVYDNGVKMEDALNVLNAPPIISNILNINPDATNPSNSAYTAAVGLADLILYQVTDITKSDASENATKAELTLKELLTWLSLFEIYWAMDGSTMRIEHVSYWSSGAIQLDATADSDGDYSYHDEFVNAEKYEWDKDPSLAFQSDNIVYPFCANEDTDVTYKAKRLNTDLAWVVSNPSNINKVSFFMMSTYLYDDGSGNKYYIIEENVTTVNGTKLEMNGHLSWRNLLKTYINYNRPQPSGVIEGLTVNFQTAKRLKIEDKFKTELCCADLVNFDGNGLITTELGNGEIRKGSWNSQTSLIELELGQDQNSC